MTLEVHATILGQNPFRFETALENYEQPVVTFLSPYQIVLQAPLKLETEDRLWMGQVLTCRPENDQWRTAVQIEHALRNLPELLNLAARFE